jgi:hypothetical protein
MPSVSRSVNGDVPIILISGALRIGYSRVLMRVRVYDNPLVDGIDWSNAFSPPITTVEYIATISSALRISLTRTR